MEDYHRFFLYGHKIRIKEDGNRRNVAMSFCQSNFSFLEFITDSLKILKTVFLYHLRNVKKRKDNSLVLRMRDYEKSFKIFCGSEIEQQKMFLYFKKLLEDVKRVPYGEYSIKNLVRKVLYDSNVATYDSTYNVDSIEKLLYHMRIKMDSEDLNKLFRKSVQNVDRVTKYDFRRIFKILLLKEELSGIYKKLINISKYEKIKKKKLPIIILINWIKERQGEEIDQIELNNFFEQLRSPNIFKLRKEQVQEIDFEEFCVFMNSPLNDLFDKKKQIQYQDTSKSINNYYISSSFNTYLIGHQHFGKSTFEGYERAIENGVRFIEIDCWDGPLREPIVTHAKTFSNSLYFKDLITELSEIAFKYTDMPLIVNLEMNCSLSQRERVAQILIENLSDKIYLMSKSSFDRENLFSLDELKNKILIKCRCVYPNYVLSKEERNKIKPEALATITTFYEEKYNEGGLRTIFGFSSFNEGKGKIISQNLMLLNSCIDFHQKYLNYIYPDLNRIDSSNYNPIMAWNLGVHAVALNQQKKDDYTLLNTSKFKENGNCGYVLKPDYLLNKKLRTHIDEKVKKTCKIKILASQIIKENFKRSDYIYPFVEIKIEGMERDMVVNKNLNSKIFQNNLFHSIYNEEDEEEIEIKLYYPELCFIKFIVRNAQTSEILKQNAIPFMCLRKGIRSLELLDESNTHDSFSYLLVDVEIGEVD